MSLQTPLNKQGELTFDYTPAWQTRVYSGIVIEGPDGLFRMVYTAYANAVTLDYGPALATSVDLATWVLPTVGLIDYPTVAGNTSNNLIIFRDNTLGSEVPMEFIDWIYAEGQYVAMVKQKASNQQQLWTSPDALTWTFVQNAFLGHVDPLGVSQYAEGKSILYDGNTYKLFYRSTDTANPWRHIGYFESATLDGFFQDKGLLPEFTPTLTRQFYDMKCWEDRGTWWASVNPYNKTTEVLGPPELWRSDDVGASWINTGGVMVEFGAGGTFDDALIAVGKPISVNGVWQYIYVGSSENHATWPRPMVFANATGQFRQGSDGTLLDDDGAVVCLYVAEGAAEVAGDVYINGTRHTADGIMYCTSDAPTVARQYINGILHTATGIRYVDFTPTGTLSFVEGLAVQSDGDQIQTIAPANPSSIKGIARDSNGAMYVST